MTTPDVRVLGLYWTLAGPVQVPKGREWSLFGFRERCEEAARAHFSGIGIWHADLEHVLASWTLREMRQILDDNGLEYLELEFLADWFLNPGDERRALADERRMLLFDAGAALGAHHIKVGNLYGTPCPLNQITDEFAALCTEAATHTTAAIVYEFMPFDANVNSVEKALAVVAGANADNGGIAIDTWHMGKLGISPDDLRAIPPEYLSWIELSDGMLPRRILASSANPRGDDPPSTPRRGASSANINDLSDETLNHRRLPGEGEFGVDRYVAVGREMGYQGPWGVEVLSQELRSLPMPEMYRRAYESTVAQLRGSCGAGG